MSEVITTPVIDKDEVRAYKITISAASSSNLIKTRNARAVFLISDTDDACEIWIPDVPASGNADNLGGVRAPSLVATGVNNGIVEPGQTPNAGRAGVIPMDQMMPLIYLKNSTGSPISVDVWVVY